MLSQFVFNKIVGIKNKGLLNKSKLLLYELMRKCILKYQDPMIQAEVSGFKLDIPLSHNLPFIFKAYPQYASNLGRLAKLVKEKYINLTCIDIGANIGDSVAILRKEAEFPILCIEGDEQYFQILNKNIKEFHQVYLENVYLGDEVEEKAGTFNKSLGTAHFVEKDHSSQTTHIKKLTEVLLGHKLFESSKMIKIDTDGYDCKIIKGALTFIAKSKPVIFFEYDPFFLSKQKEEDLSIFEILKINGYKGLLIYDNYGDFMISLDISNTAALEDIHNYFSGKGGTRYCDICAFHSEDNDLWEDIRASEIYFFRNK